ncbi:unnamed protein product [Brassicogethes aeneus]|uniref:Uncharacterized protein n=1 Tax=Brassicogethes aeneus TaxID=1431903 RepID=A0A9P0FHZ4_BRAAE|nr:unnamed protein product [Brassicogethes aeneus]
MDVITYWKSTLDMLERVVSLQESLEAPEIVKILKPFKHLTEEMSSQKEVTISKVLAGNIGVIQVLSNIEFNARFKNSSRYPLLAKAPLLHPKFKRQTFFDDSSYDQAKNSLKKEIKQITWAPLASVALE